MMQTARPRHGDDPRSFRHVCLRLATCRSLLHQSEMRSAVVVITDVLGHEQLAMAFTEYDYVIEQIATAGTNKAFGNAILPGALDARPLRFNPEGSDRVNNAVTKV